ncbi:MAG: AAA family ATPase [Spartobacteria bacterium]|nr:AAA family ATPase [Spartobacteria bacterium]
MERGQHSGISAMEVAACQKGHRDVIADSVEELLLRVADGIGAAIRELPAQEKALRRLQPMLFNRGLAQIHTSDKANRPIFIMTNPGFGAAHALRTLADSVGLRFVAATHTPTSPDDFLDVLREGPPVLLLLHLTDMQAIDRSPLLTWLLPCLIHGHRMLGDPAISPFESALLNKCIIFIEIVPPCSQNAAAEATPEDLATQLSAIWNDNGTGGAAKLRRGILDLVKNDNTVIFCRTPCRYMVDYLKGEMRETLALLRPVTAWQPDEPTVRSLIALLILARGYPAPKDVGGTIKSLCLELFVRFPAFKNLAFDSAETAWADVCGAAATTETDWPARLENHAKRLDCRKTRLDYSLEFDAATGTVLVCHLRERAPVQPEARFIIHPRPRYAFSQVAGHAEAKERCRPIINFIRNPEPFKRMDCVPPMCLLLHGDAGTGKTMFAEAVAGEAGLPFIAISAGDFMTQEYAGQGAALMREVFQTAAACKPCVVFLDEIDSLSSRSKIMESGGSASIDQAATLNTLLPILDSAGASHGVLVIGATNRMADLDPALTRPGRFGCHIKIGALTEAEREALVRKALNPRNCDDYECIVRELCLGMADMNVAANIKALVEEVKVHTVTAGKARVDIDSARAVMDRKLPARERVRLGGKDKARLAWHEAGHALMLRLLMPGAQVDSITIHPRGAALGAVCVLQDNAGALVYPGPERLISQIMMCMAGVVAEEIAFGTAEISCESDIRASLQAAKMLQRTMASGIAGMKRMVAVHLAEKLSSKNERMEAWVTDVMLICRTRAWELFIGCRPALARVANTLRRQGDMKVNQLDALLAGTRVDRQGIIRQALDEIHALPGSAIRTAKQEG